MDLDSIERSAGRLAAHSDGSAGDVRHLAHLTMLNTRAIQGLAQLLHDHFSQTEPALGLKLTDWIEKIHKS